MTIFENMEILRVINKLKKSILESKTDEIFIGFIEKRFVFDSINLFFKDYVQYEDYINIYYMGR